jgi:hypothetical protein
MPNMNRVWGSKMQKHETAGSLSLLVHWDLVQPRVSNTSPRWLKMDKLFPGKKRVPLTNNEFLADILFATVEP